MAAKKYFQDRIVLLLLSINVFLALLASILVLLRIDTGSGAVQIIQYRPRLGLGAFYEAGSATGLISFIVFALLVAGFHAFLSFKIYHIRRYFAIAVLSLGTLLLVLTLVISNSLLIL
jgi:hypothetical protein